MAVLRQPGTTIDWTLPEERDKDPEDRTIFVLRVLTWDEWKSFTRKLQNVERSASAVDNLENTRKALGVGLVEVRNLKILGPDGTERDFVLERAGTDLAPESMAVLMNYSGPLIRAIQEASEFGVRDVKNSP